MRIVFSLKLSGGTASSVYTTKVIDKIYPVQVLDFRQTGCSAARLAHLLWEQGVGGSNPLTPTNVKYCGLGA